VQTRLHRQPTAVERRFGGAGGGDPEQGTEVQSFVNQEYRVKDFQRMRKTVKRAETGERKKKERDGQTSSTTSSLDERKNCGSC
jgi:hypothetical protein